MAENYQIDSTDRKILELLLLDARRPYLEIARKLKVSGGTIHQRIEKLREAGILTGSQVTLNAKKLGLGVTVLLGIHLNSAKEIQKVISILKKFPEVVEAQYTTGSFALFIKIMVADIEEFHHFLVQKIQAMPEIRSTESFICLDEPIHRSHKLP